VAPRQADPGVGVGSGYESPTSPRSAPAGGIRAEPLAPPPSRR
jgi:hypothetical protein